MDDLIRRQDAERIVSGDGKYFGFVARNVLHEMWKDICSLPSAEPTLRIKALSLLLDWAIECGFCYDNIPEEYEMYKKNIENMGYKEGLIYIAERELERNERHNI